MCWARIERRLRIFESNYGRRSGWFVERDGRCVAVLNYRGLGEMFWDSYSVEIVTTDAAEREWLLNVHDMSVWTSKNLRFRNREFDEVVTGFGGVFIDERGVTALLRGLYLPRFPPLPWEWLLLWIRRRRVFGKQTN